ESDSDDEYVSKASVEQEKPISAFINTVKHVKTLKQTIQDQDMCSQNPKVDQQDWTDLKSKRMSLGYGYTKKACFVCGSLLTKTGRFLVNAARQNFTSQAISTSIARKVNTARPKVYEIRPRHNMYKSHSPIRRPFNRTTSPKANFAQHKVNTAGDKSVRAVRGKWETAVKASAGCNWRYKRHYWNKDNPHQTLKGKGIVDSGCSRHMTGNKAYLIDYQYYNGGHVAFGGCKCLITGKVLLRVPRQHNMYSFNLKNIVPSGGLACLLAKATVDESTKWHRRMTILVLLVTKESNTRPSVRPK
nr:hypothetical protein [Tanacetum cinerariifolium]